MTSRILLAGLAIAFGTALPAQAAQRTFVSPSGEDVNVAVGCPANAPCRQVTAALSVTDAGGEIVATGSGEYANFSIDRDVTIGTAPGSYAAISAGQQYGAGITIGLPIAVTLKGLTFKGGQLSIGLLLSNYHGGKSVTVTNCFFDGITRAISMMSDGHLSVIESKIANSQEGIIVGNGATVSIANTAMTQIAGKGIETYGGNSTGQATVTATDTHIDCQNKTSAWGFSNRLSSAATVNYGRMHLTRVTVSNCYVGIGNVPPTPDHSHTITISDSTVTNNSYGFLNNAGNTFISAGNNHLSSNGFDVGGTITTAASLLK